MCFGQKGLVAVVIINMDILTGQSQKARGQGMGKGLQKQKLDYISFTGIIIT
jgi:hypothetical protein